MQENAIKLNHPVCQVEKLPDGVLVTVGELERTPWATFNASQVILALPPRLAAASILFTPDLSHRLTQAMMKTGTWMAGQAKFSALYSKPFWREIGLSGQAFSEYGPLGEIHDGSNNDKGPYGLTGFVGIPADQRRQLRHLDRAIFRQLTAIFGEKAAQPAAFFYHDWARERFTATQYDQPPMRTHPCYSPPDNRQDIWGGKAIFAGTETAVEYGGYLEGALGAAEQAVKCILDRQL